MGQILGTMLTVAGTATSMYGSYEQGQAQSTAALYQAQVARNNATTAATNADLSIQAGDVNAMTKGLQTRNVVGEMKAAQGASNIDVNTGSAAAVRTGAEETGQLDAATIRSNAAKEAYGFRVQGTSDIAQSQLDTMEAAQARKAGNIGMLSSFLSGASSLAGQWSKYQMGGGGAGGDASGGASVGASSGGAGVGFGA